MQAKADRAKAIKWLHQLIDDRVNQRIRELGMPGFLISGVVSTTRVTNGNTFADVYLNGSAVSSTNIPVNPDIAANVTANTPVWVLQVNFNSLDLYVLARKLA
ncbi:hypothetical protein [Alicyclobacillus dauci]|uniref:Uncharacterized protein n=1 Tax=Alicyclobacillus dauci TaxID=1475485 RepID=A0ABY6YYA0_9BACL|nr:hypothetical protein [Alicyclobacillus dauci]WAH35054.1 hypothetical protein NZD86_12020 [Alicyclobacillus dauci]